MLRMLLLDDRSAVDASAALHPVTALSSSVALVSPTAASLGAEAIGSLARGGATGMRSEHT
jgi:hypothetical protein